MPRLRKLPPGFVRVGSSAAAPLREGRDSSANYWYFHSNKLDHLLLIESDVLFASIVMLELRPDVLSFDCPDEQASGEDPEAAADLDVRFDDGRRELLWCRRNSPSSEWRPAIPVGYEGRLITGQDIDNARLLFDNSLMLSGAITASRSYDRSAAFHSVLKKFAVQSTATVGELLSIRDIDPAFLYAALGELLADGTLTADLEGQLLSTTSVISKPERRESHRRPAMPGRLTSEPSFRMLLPGEGKAPEDDSPELLPSRRRRLIPQAQLLAVWPLPDPREIPDAKRPRYEKRKRIVDAYRKGASYKNIHGTLSVSEGEVRRLVTRCLTPCNGGIVGYYGCIPGKHLAQLRGAVAGVEKEADGAGSSSWSRLLDQVEGLDALIKKLVLGGGDAPKEGRDLDIDEVHRRVVEFLHAAGLDSADYPLTNADEGRNAVARYVQKVGRRHLVRFTRIYHGESAAKRAKHTGQGLRRIIRPMRPGSFVQLDYWRTDKVSKISMPNRYGESFETALPKWYYAILVDEMYSTVLSGFPTLEKTPSTESALECLDRHVHPDQYRHSDFAGNGAANPGLCFAGELLSALRGTKADAFRVDNAWANLSDAFIRAAVYEFGAAVNFGPTYTWVTRAIVECVIGIIARLTGKAVCADSAVDIGVLRRALDEACRDHNTMPNERLNYSTPVSAMSNAMRQRDAGLIAIPLPRDTVEKGRLLDNFFMAPVRGDVKKGVRPYVQQFRRRYSSEVLGQEAELLRSRGEPVYAECSVKWYDVRLCQAVVSGKALGTLVPDRQQDVLISVRDAKALRLGGTRRKARDKREKSIARANANQRRRRETKQNTEALRRARADQSEALHSRDATVSMPVDVVAQQMTASEAPAALEHREESVLRAWGKRKATSGATAKKTQSREITLRTWRSPSRNLNLPVSGGNGGRHE